MCLCWWVKLWIPISLYGLNWKEQREGQWQPDLVRWATWEGKAFILMRVKSEYGCHPSSFVKCIKPRRGLRTHTTYIVIVMTCTLKLAWSTSCFSPEHCCPPPPPPPSYHVFSGHTKNEVADLLRTQQLNLGWIFIVTPPQTPSPHWGRRLHQLSKIVNREGDDRIYFSPFSHQGPLWICNIWYDNCWNKGLEW